MGNAAELSASVSGDSAPEIPGFDAKPARGRNMAVYCAHAGLGKIAEHAHDTLQITVLFEPTVCLLRWPEKTTGTMEERLAGPALVLFAPGQPHAWEWQHQGDAIVLQLDRRMRQKLVPKLRATVVVATPAAARDLMVWQFANLLRQICLAANPNEIPLLGIVAEGVATRVAAVIGRAVPVPERSLTQALLEKVEEFVRAQLAYDIHVDDLAQLTGYSVPHFSTLFKATMGITPSDYIFKRRMLRADELLRTGNYLIGEVAKLVGYLDQGHFTGLFRGHFGYPPRVVLREARAESANRPKIS